jgi:Tol biopolymer transport system component
MIAAGQSMALSSSQAGEPQRLTHDGRQKSTPVFRAGGEELVYVDFVDPTLFQLRKLTLSDGKSERLHADAKASEFEPAISADGECLAYCKLRGVLSISIVVRDKNGTEVGEILPGAGFCGYRSPALAPDHARVAFSYAENGTQQIYTAKLNGEDRKLLAESSGLNNWPVYSPDGKSIAFGSSRDGNFEIYRMKADGSEVKRLTEHPLQDIRPCFSPDGTRIAFTSHRDGNAEIYVMQSDGTGLTRVTENEGRDDYAAWHPDGKRLAIVSERDGKVDLYLIDVP